MLTVGIYCALTSVTSFSGFHTGSHVSIHSVVLLSTNSPLMKFLVVPPVALVPFH